MYVPLNDDNDEILTNPDLFSDTNSQAGSHTTDDQFVPLPDSASETGVCPQMEILQSHSVNSKAEIFEV